MFFEFIKIGAKIRQVIKLKKSHHFVVLLLLFYLVSCTKPNVSIPTVVPNVVTTNIPVSNTERLEPTVTISPSPIPVIRKETTPIAVTITETLPVEMTLCSPLALHSLDGLSDIISDPYNPPPPGSEARHHGVDFSYYHFGDRDTMQGEPVLAVLQGVVAGMMENRNPYGNMVIVETQSDALSNQLIELIGIGPGESLYILYAHMNYPPLVKLGDLVVACKKIGEVGLSGFTAIPHLHLETRLGPSSHVFESMVFYDTRAKPEEMETYRLWRTSGMFRHFDPMLILNYKPTP